MDKSVGIIGTGSCLPEKIVTNYDLEKIMDTKHEWIVDRTGIERRRIADKSTASSDLGVKAAEIALEDAGVTAEEIDLIITATLSPDMPFPSTACVIQDKLGAFNAFAFDLNAACTGFLYSLSTAAAFIKSGQAKKVLVVGVEVLSKIVNWNDRKTAVLFADGAGAAVVTETEEENAGLLSTALGADGTGWKFLYMPAGGTRMPATYETVEKDLHTIVMDGSEVFKFAARKMAEVSLEAIEKAGLKLEDVDYLVPHQANVRIIKNAAKRLKIDMDKVYLNIHDYGNMSAASVPIALDEAYRKGSMK
ncbi:MAG: ketoacyl-ACP synthase III, partial [Clostridia bacterium]|nr:ketoacyl-ACP synthase III [Clostridia bacterium]